MSAFKSTHFEFDKPVKKGSKKNEVKWYFEDISEDDVVHVEPGCGCTADCEVVHDGIKAVYKDGTSPTNIERGDGSHYTFKTVTAYMDDGKPLEVKRRGNQRFNPNKKQYRLTFLAKVVE